jgi:dihydrolipoamide dehydrogenase
MQTFDLIIIGGGPAGYVAAIRASQLGMKTAVVEKQKMGGMCLNWGCIPSKAFIETAKLYTKISKAASFGIDGVDKNALNINWQKTVARKDRIVTRLVKGVEFLMKKNGVEVITGEAKIIDVAKIAVGETEYGAKKLLIATGSRPKRKEYKGIDPKKIVEIDQFFSMNEIPDSFLIDGGRINACELAHMLRMTGRKVTMVTEQDELIPFMDKSIRDFITDKFKKSGITVYTNREITKDGQDGVFVGDNFVECDLVINAMDRKAVLPEMGSLELEMNGEFIKINEFMQTSNPNVYAAGDVTKQFFAQIASAQGLAAVNHMADIKEKLDYDKLPINMYTEPEIAYVGLTEEQLKEKGVEYKSGTFPISINGKAMIEGNTEGFVKILYETKYGEVVGVHIVAADATDMIAEAVMAMKLESTVDDVAHVVHAHPTVSETFLEASYVAADKPVHI